LLSFLCKGLLVRFFALLNRWTLQIVEDFMGLIGN
jgi:hypothetical protein